MRIAVTGVVAALGSFGWSAIAQARPIRAGQLPNTIGCAICHVDPGGGGARTPVGDDTLLALNGNNVDWPALCLLDSDRDMLTNGAELGDPRCVWQIGQPAPPVQSDPNDGDDPVEGGGAGGAGGGVGEPDRFCLAACDAIAACAVDGPRCPDLRPRDEAATSALCAQACVQLPALPIAVDRAADCDEMVAFINGASPAFADACGVEPMNGEGGAGGSIEPECVPFCDRVADCAGACPDSAAIDAWCPDACANQPALRALAADSDGCGDLIDLLTGAADGFGALCREQPADAGTPLDAGVWDLGLTLDAAPVDQGAPPDAGPGIDADRPADAAPTIVDADATPNADASPATRDGSPAAPAPATVEGCATRRPPATSAWWLLGLLLWRRRR